MSRRLSMGGRMTPLRDGTSRINNSSSMSSSFRSETPGKDRRALLDEWRQSRGGGGGGGSSMKDPAASKRQRLHNDGPPLLPPGGGGGGRGAASSSSAAAAPTWTEEGTTALERFRKRKLLMQQQQQQQQTIDGGGGNINGSFDDERPGNSSLLCFDDQDDTITINPYASGRRGGGGGSRKARRMTLMPTSSSRQSLLAPEPPQHHDYSYNSSAASAGINNNNSSLLDSSRTSLSQGASASLSQLTVESEPLPPRSGSSNQPDDAVSLVEGAGLRSQIREMQQRIEQLEREKMKLSMAKAPLEARFRQREDEWIREQARLLEEIEGLKADMRQADERYRDLVLHHEAAEEELTRLRLEVRKASSTLNVNGGGGGFGDGSSSSAWSRQLQNDRDVKELREKLRGASEDLNVMRLSKNSVEKELHATRIELEALSRGYEELQQEYDQVAKSTSDNRDAEIRLEVLTTEHQATAAQLNAVASDLAATKARAEATQAAMEEEHKKEVEAFQFEISVLNTRAGNNEKYRASTDGSSGDDEQDAAVLVARIEERDRRIAELEAEVLRGEEVRRQMHNRIQELRGNIRVFVRARPFLPSDKQREHPAIDVSPDGESLSIVDSRSSSSHTFKFDKVFPPSSGQDHIFGEVCDFVQSALDGYQVCLFSYGQTGSGKTHTMQGSGNGAMKGIIPRAVEQILKQSKIMHNQKWDFNLSASFLEIYNENLKDLLTRMSQDKSVQQNPPKLAIKRNREGKSYVEGLTEVQIDTTDSEKGMMQLDALMAVAARARSVASTKMNAQSSRSHSVFMLHIRGYNIESGAVVHGSLNLCDLAGSERLDRSGANNDAKRLRETQAINKSLSCLGDVFNALSKGASHIPYRNSKLTYLLQDCLSGDGKALMFVNLSPTTASSNESLCSLRFAQRVNQVELGKPTKNIQYQS